MRKKTAEFFFIDNVSDDCFRVHNKCNDDVTSKLNNKFDEKWNWKSYFHFIWWINKIKTRNLDQRSCETIYFTNRYYCAICWQKFIWKKFEKYFQIHQNITNLWCIVAAKSHRDFSSARAKIKRFKIQMNCWCRWFFQIWK